MTKEQAIRRLEDLQRLYLGNEKFTADIEAIEIAIEAIRNGTPLPKGNEREAYNMGYKDGVEAYKAMMEIEKEEA